MTNRRFAVTRRSMATWSPRRGGRAPAPGHPDFLLLVRDHRELANVEQVLIERVPGSSSVQGFGGRSFTDAWHAASYGLEPQFGTLGEGTRGTRITMCLGNSDRRNRI